jgi:signal transduction histidine kinase
MTSSIQLRGQAAQSCERVLLRAFTLVRLAIFAESAVAGALVWRHFRHPLIVVGILGVALVESAAVVVVSRRRGTFDSGALVALDVALSVGALITICLTLKASADPYSDNFLYPYTVASMSIVGLSLRRAPAVLLVPLVVAGSYMGMTVTRFGLRGPLVPNCMTYWAFSVVSWGLANHYRRLSRDLDQAREETVAREVEIEIERERSRNFRELHDRVLQTLEIMSRDTWVSDARVRAHIASEAAWLRRLIERGLQRGEGGDLVAALEEVIKRQTMAGLRVELNAAEVGRDPLPDTVTRALAGAVNEALTNVRKHSGCVRAVVRATRTRDGVVVSVLDHGVGFDPERVELGVGITQSLVARMRQVEGTARIDSAPGAGTCVELWAPWPPGPGDVP